MSIFEQLALTSEPWQERVVTSAAPRIIVNGARRVGKTTAGCVAALDTALGAPNRQILLVGQDRQQARALMRTIYAFLSHLDMPVRRHVDMTLKLANGSELLSQSFRTLNDVGRPHLVVVDEAAFVPDETVEAVLEMDAPRVILLSTPRKASGVFHKIWTDATGWHRETAPAAQCSWISDETLARMRIGVEPRNFAQEIECQFI